jgi:hypothetical protein
VVKFKLPVSETAPDIELASYVVLPM